jgi:hypothetical protein
MRQRISVIQVLVILAAFIMLTHMSHSVQAQENPPSNNVSSFVHSLIGEWVGTCVQTTDDVASDNKYFHAVVKQSGPDTYETVKIIGKAEVLLDLETIKPEQHDLSEVLRVSPSGGLEGTGSGSIKVSGMPRGLGENGKVQDYRSSWTQSNGVLSMIQHLKVKFTVLFFSKSFTIFADYTARPGSDIVGLMKRAKTMPAARRKHLRADLRELLIPRAKGWGCEGLRCRRICGRLLLARLTALLVRQCKQYLRKSRGRQAAPSAFDFAVARAVLACPQW